MGLPTHERLAVTGGRDYTDWETVCVVLDLLSPIEIAEGEARGLDRLAKRWAESRGVPCKPYAAKWRRPDGTKDPGAGFARNLFMLQDFNPDALVVFPGNNGTAHCRRTANRLSIRVYWYDPIRQTIVVSA